MKIYLLIDVHDTDSGFGANVTPFTDKEAAQAALRKDWERTVKDWGFDRSMPVTDEHYSECQEDNAAICDGTEVESWRIEEREVNVSVAVEHNDGLVRNVYANAGLNVEVYALDVSDFPDRGEQEAADERAAELAALINSPGWGRVW